MSMILTRRGPPVAGSSASGADFCLLGEGEVDSLRRSLVESMVGVDTVSLDPVQEQVRGPGIRIECYPTVPMVGALIHYGVANVH